MNRLFLLGAGVVLITLFSCKIETDSDKIRKNYWDTLNIPDKYNTGADENTDFQKITETTVINGVTILYDVRTDSEGKITTNQYQISSYKQNSTFPAEVLIKDYDFSDKSFCVSNSDRYSENKHITFENCKFAGIRNDTTKAGSSRVYLTFNHCSFGGGVNSAYITLNDCKIGGFTSDAMNPVREFYANNVYVYNLVTKALDGEVHIDGIQIYGDQSARNNVVNDKWICTNETGDIQFKNIRFEIPAVNLGETKAYVNSCMMVQLEFSDVENILFDNMTVNGGGLYYALRLNSGKHYEMSIHEDGWSHKNLKVRNVRVSNNYSPLIYYSIPDPDYENVVYTEQIYVTSVWKDDSGIAHVITSNDTKSAQNLVVKTNVGTKTFYIPHSPSDWVMSGKKDVGPSLNPRVKTDEQLTDENGRAYSTYTWEDMPYDLDCEISGNPSFVVCYQGENKIRYVSLDGKTHYYSEIDETIRN